MEYTGSKITKMQYYEEGVLIGYDEVTWVGDEILFLRAYSMNENSELELRVIFNFTYTDGKVSKIVSDSSALNQELYYFWTGNNVSKIISYEVSSGNFLYGITYEYDDKKNIYETLSDFHYAYSIGYMSENNIILSTSIDENGTPGRTSTITYTYNSSGYPKTATKVNNENEPGEEPETEFSTFEYVCE